MDGSLKQGSGKASTTPNALPRVGSHNHRRKIIMLTGRYASTVSGTEPTAADLYAAA